MKIIALGLLLSGSIALSLAAEPQHIVFERGSAIWIANIDGTKAQKITQGSGPSLSPDGTRIAFNTDNSDKDLVREIAIADIATKKVTIVKEIPSKNCYHALWSPDGKQILFYLWNGNDWDLAMIAPDSSGLRTIRKADSEHHSLWSTCWAVDGKSIFAQDLDYLYQLNLEGAEMKKWKLETLFPAGGMNSGGTIAVSPDGKTLLVEVDMDEEVTNMPDWEGPPPSLWTFDLESGKATRLTEKGKLAASGCWLDKTHILFNLFSPKEKQPSLYEMEIGKKEMKRIIKDAANPSVSGVVQ